MLNIKNLNQLKKTVKPGMTVKVKNFLKNTEEIRPILKVQTNGFYSGREVFKDEIDKDDDTIYEVNGKFYKGVWVDYQKSSQMKFIENKVYFLAFEVPKLSWQEKNPISPSNDFKVGEPWLIMEFYE